MSIVVIGTFYKTEKRAVAEAQKKDKEFGRQVHAILKTQTGYIVVTKRQLGIKETRPSNKLITW